MFSWVGSLTFAKSAYVLIICLIIVVLVRELYVVLWKDTLYVGNFQYFTDGRSSEEHSKAFPAYVLGQHQLLRSALIEENHRRELVDKSLSSGVRYHRSLPSDLPEAARWSSILTDAELKIQGFDIGKVLTTLRAWVAPPVEINGFVEKSGETARAAINYPSRKLADGSRTPASPFETGVLNGDASVALAVAASIVWTQAAEADAGFGKIPREVFVSWILTWWDYRLLRGRTDTNQVWTPEDKNRWKQARALVDSLASGTNVYAETWRLRADLIETIPAGLKSDTGLRTSDQIAGDANLVVEDRRRYAEADGVATAISALNQISQAAPRTTAVLTDIKIAAVAETVKSLLADRTLYPGRPVWVRPASPMPTTDLFSITATAIVKDGETQKLLLPDYVMSGAVDDAEYEFRLSPSEPAIARAKRSDLLFPDGQPSGGVLLAPLAPNTDARNVSKGEAIALKPAIADLPPDGGDLQLVTSRGTDKVMLKSRTGLFANVDRITGPGDGGAPVIDSNQALVAMAYSGSGTESTFLSLKWLLAKKPALQLIQ